MFRKFVVLLQCFLIQGQCSNSIKRYEGFGTTYICLCNPIPVRIAGAFLFCLTFKRNNSPMPPSASCLSIGEARCKLRNLEGAVLSVIFHESPSQPKSRIFDRVRLTGLIPSGLIIAEFHPPISVTKTPIWVRGTSAKSEASNP